MKRVISDVKYIDKLITPNLISKSVKNTFPSSSIDGTIKYMNANTIIATGLKATRNKLFKGDKKNYKLFISELKDKKKQQKIIAIAAKSIYMLLKGYWEDIDNHILNMVSLQTGMATVKLFAKGTVSNVIYATKYYDDLEELFAASPNSIADANKEVMKIIHKNKAPLIAADVDMVETDEQPPAFFDNLSVCAQYALEIIQGEEPYDFLDDIVASSKADPIYEKIAKSLIKSVKNIEDEASKLAKKQKGLRDEIRKKHAKQAAEAKARAKAAIKKEKQMKKNRKNNLFCKNDVEFFSRENIEDIPTKDLTIIKLDKALFCYDEMYFTGMMQHAKSQFVRGLCKKPIPGKPLDCKEFVPINIGNNVFIPMENYEDIMKKHKTKRKFELVNKRMVDFTTGLHIMSQKSGKDVVYDLKPANFSTSKITEAKKQTGEAKKKVVKKRVTKRNIKKIGSSKESKLKAQTVVQLKKKAKEKKIKGYSKMNKAQLVRALNK